MVIEALITMIRDEGFPASSDYIDHLTQNLDGGYYDGKDFYFDFLPADDVYSYNYTSTWGWQDRDFFIIGSNGSSEYLAICKKNGFVYFLPMTTTAAKKDKLYLAESFPGLFAL